MKSRTGCAEPSYAARIMLLAMQASEKYEDKERVFGGFVSVRRMIRRASSSLPKARGVGLTPRNPARDPLRRTRDIGPLLQEKQRRGAVDMASVSAILKAQGARGA
jgi:hypothetical protein